MSSTRIAIIDLGTNTFNLLVAEKNGTKIKRILSTKDGVALGLGGINQNSITEDAIDRAMKTLTNFCAIGKENKVDKYFAFGTSAIRNATNAPQFITRVQNELNLKIDVISGAREAELIYKGVCLGYNFIDNALIMDIGGGSTEFILANANGIIKAQSFEIGVSRIYQLFKFSDPLTVADCAKIVDYLETETHGFFNDVVCTKLIGASGSFETFYKMATLQDFPEDTYLTMSLSDVNKSLTAIIESTQLERDKNPLIIPIRKKMAPMAAVKTKWIIEKLKITELVISPFALKEGVIAEIDVN